MLAMVSTFWHVCWHLADTWLTNFHIIYSFSLIFMSIRYHNKGNNRVPRPIYLIVADHHSHAVGPRTPWQVSKELYEARLKHLWHFSARSSKRSAAACCDRGVRFRQEWEDDYDWKKSYCMMNVAYGAGAVQQFRIKSLARLSNGKQIIAATQRNGTREDEPNTTGQGTEILWISPYYSSQQDKSGCSE